MNRLSRLVNRINQFPSFVRSPLLSLAFNSKVKFAGTAGIEILELSSTKAVVRLKNRRKVQNHIGGVHATAMALLAESATGIVFGMNVPDTHLPLCKSMKVNYEKRTKGDMVAVATLTPEEIQQIQSSDKGSITVKVEVTDTTQTSPISTELVWAWVKKREEKQ
eukprot:TRINITY_DN1979_c0_g1_i1.p1 TRINITY_DN1979_c0_g1~~TRINITY_DN1979_c0_g1_i1.p1  ORF type:complete len:179 (+),score=44.86 TRINITY_DN1979_c0_g1_i1:47-538(+)